MSLEDIRVVEARKDCDIINESKFSWAEVEVVMNRVSLKVGQKWSGRKEIPAVRIDYVLTNDGKIKKNYSPGL